MLRRLFATLKGLRGFAVNNAGATPPELRLEEMGCVFPGLPKRNPGLELANAFSVIVSDKSSQRVDGSFWLERRSNGALGQRCHDVIPFLVWVQAVVA